MAAMSWTDEDLLARHGRARVGEVEIGLKETRQHGPAPGFQRLATFLQAYNQSDIHLVSPIPSRMLREVRLLSFLRCGGFLNFLGTHKLWIGRGGSRSVVHRDDAENVNCALAGRKRFALVHPRWRAKLEAHPNSAGPPPRGPDRFGFIDARLDPQQPGYGAYFQLDVDAMDLIRYPGWREVDWYQADLEAGDCIYIPHGWYHQVRAGPSRTVNVMVWYWRPERFEASTCTPRQPGGGPRFSDCSWGYMPPPGNGPPRGVVQHEGVGLRLTKCSRAGLHLARWPVRTEL
ncbi:unnamed protein product [Polarella glacialis]|nr:unnamed protein product [Polarella glacialis]